MNRTCACGKSFSTTNPQKLYCTLECSREAARARSAVEFKAVASMDAGAEAKAVARCFGDWMDGTPRNVLLERFGTRVVRLAMARRRVSG